MGAVMDKQKTAVCGLCGHDLTLHGDGHFGCRAAEVETPVYGAVVIAICGCTLLQKQEKVA